MSAPRVPLAVRLVSRHRVLARWVLLLLAVLGAVDATWSALSHEIGWWHALFRVVGSFAGAWMVGWYAPRALVRSEQEQDESNFS